MRYKAYMYIVLFVVVMSVLLSSFLVVGAERTYLGGSWLLINNIMGQKAYALCTYQESLTASGVVGTVFCSTTASFEWPTPDGGTVTVTDKMHGEWQRTAAGQFKMNGIALVTNSDGKVMGTLETAGTLSCQGEDKLTNNATFTLRNLEGQELFSLPVTGELTRIGVD